MSIIKRFVMGGVFGLFVGILVLALNNPVQTNAQYSCPAGSAWAKWDLVSTISYYNIYYRQADEKTWTHSVPQVNASRAALEITCLKTNVTYYYIVSGVNINGQETFITPERVLRYGGGGTTVQQPVYYPAPVVVPGKGTGRG